MNEEEMNNLMESVAETMPKGPEIDNLSQGSNTMTNISIPKAVKRNITKDINLEEMVVEEEPQEVQEVPEPIDYSRLAGSVNKKIRQEFQDNLLFVPKITDKKNG